MFEMLTTAKWQKKFLPGFFAVKTSSDNGKLSLPSLTDHNEIL